MLENKKLKQFKQMGSNQRIQLTQLQQLTGQLLQAELSHHIHPYLPLRPWEYTYTLSYKKASLLFAQTACLAIKNS